MTLKKIAAGALAGAMMLGTVALPAFASNAGDGSDYGTQPGYTVAQSQTACSGAGAFDAFGKDANLGNAVSGHATFVSSYPGPGTDGQQTGANNSSLCGNPQN